MMEWIPAASADVVNVTVLPVIVTMSQCGRAVKEAYCSRRRSGYGCREGYRVAEE
jgi:hypothetical protein